MKYGLGEDDMDTKDRWTEVKQQLEGAPLTLSPKMSATLRYSGNGFLFILARYKFALKKMQFAGQMIT